MGSLIRSSREDENLWFLFNFKFLRLFFPAALKLLMKGLDLVSRHLYRSQQKIFQIKKSLTRLKACNKLIQLTRF